MQRGHAKKVRDETSNDVSELEIIHLNSSSSDSESQDSNSSNSKEKTSK